MVQIILALLATGKTFPMYLYIPHGSDNTNIQTCLIVKKDGLYIPHGSDNTLQLFYQRIEVTFLYIPHGSDNTNSELDLWVNDARLYIPHGSDNTYKIDEVTQPAVPTALYPTWFR